VWYLSDAQSLPLRSDIDAQFWAYTSDFSYGAAVYAALMVAISTIPAYLLSRRMVTLARMGQR
jgi:hypothetical protein